MAKEENEIEVFILDDFIEEITQSYEKVLVNLIRNPEKRKEWEIPLTYLGGRVISFCYDDSINMRDVFPSVISRALCELAALAKEYGFDREDVLDIAAEGEEYIESMSDDFFAGMERGVFYLRIVEGLESIGCHEDAEVVRKMSKKWLEWQKTAEAPQEYTDFERAYMAAEAGNAKFQFVIGKFYIEDDFVWGSQLLGSIWIALSASNGSEEGKKWCEDNGIDHPTQYVLEKFREYSDFT